MNQGLIRTAAAAAIALAFSSAGAQEISSDALGQMGAIASTKANLTPAQKKMDSKLVFGIYKATNDSRIAPFTNAVVPLSEATPGVSATAATSAPATASSSVVVEIKGKVTPDLTAAITAAGGTILYQSSRWDSTTASVPVQSVTSLAGRADVSRIKLPPQAGTNVGSVTSQGVIAHQANTVVNTMHVDGTGVSVGVLSDSASAARVAALVASGDLPAGTTVLSGQQGPTSGEDEGAAMMEIIHDMAPGAKLYFATAFLGEASFADNIIALAQAGCKVIVDDVSYSDEFAFQDGIIAQAVNYVTQNYGVIYFSSAANSGSITKGTSGTWEGDFKDGGATSGAVLASGETGNFHNFAATGVQNYNVLTTAINDVVLFWSDPIGASNNDYDLFILNGAGTQVIGFSGDAQDGTAPQDPVEEIYNPNANYPAGSRIVVVKYAGAARAMHIDTDRATLSIATTGSTHGHNAGLNTVSMAATYWNSAKTGSRAFTGMSNTTETFSSDGPRKIFYNADGSPITPNNFLFGTNGGTTLQKPDLSAADGVTTHTPGFLPFFGTSASAPHAAAIAALVRQARPDYTVAQVKTAMTATALDTNAVGVDRDSGYGIAMANAAVQYALTH